MTRHGDVVLIAALSADKGGARRCQAIVTKITPGHFLADRYQCSAAALANDDLCGTHRRKADRQARDEAARGSVWNKGPQ